MSRKKCLFSWTKFYSAHLVSATVENAAATDVVLTFAPAIGVKAFSKSLAAQFTLAGKTVDSITVDTTAGTVTIAVTVGYTTGSAFDLTHNPALKGATVVTSVTNNVE